MLLWLLIGTLIAQPAVPADDVDIAALEQQLFRAMEERNRVALEVLLAPDFVSRGLPEMTRETWLANAITLCWGPQWDVQQLTVREQGTTQIATFVLNFYRDPLTCRPAALRSLITDVWVWRDSRWQLALRHSGPVGESGPRSQYGPAPLAPSPFEGRAELSFVATGGNASTETLGFSTELIRRGSRATTNGRASFLRSATDGIENARTLNAQVRHGVRLSERVEAFGRGVYLRDLFSGIEHRTNADAGFSYVVPQPVQRALKFDFGLGATRENRLASEDLTVLNATLGASFRARLTPTSEITADAQTVSDLERLANWRLISDLSLNSTLHSRLSIRLAYGTRYTNRPVPGFFRTDHTVSASLVLRYLQASPDRPR